MPAHPRIAILSFACRFPDAISPAQLWTNVVEGRRSFRPIPPNRLDLSRYAAASIGEADSITPIYAGLVSNWNFDRGRFRIAKTTFETTDLTHWLALDLAAEAIETIGGTSSLDRTRTAVIVANTLTGEFSRASLLRLRAPFLDDLVASAAEQTGLSQGQSKSLRQHFLNELNERFPPPTEDSLAGSLANTIAGRIANYFDLHGGAYTVDGACASSLLAVANATNLLARDEADAVIVGAVDLSLDPFELVGFSRNGALAQQEMRVFDAQSNGFWPGEGGAFAVLMRAKDALRRELPALAYIRGCGLSTDGAGGLTRPSVAGQVLAAQRAYAAAAVDPVDLAFVEAHGTGTAVGDPIEVRALAELREGARNSLPIGSIKANIGHCKAAAGFAGLIKAVSALQQRIVPPHVSCSTPHPVFSETENRLRPALHPESIADVTPLSGVSGFGFGGVNAHIVLEGAERHTTRTLLPSSPRSHGCELFIFAGERQDILQQMGNLGRRAASMSSSEVADAAAFISATVGKGPVRAAIVAGGQSELGERLARAIELIRAGHSANSAGGGVFIGEPKGLPRLGFIFPGQAAPARLDGGIWEQCFDCAANMAQRLHGKLLNSVATEVAQPAIMAANLAAISLMSRLGLTAEVAVGHSLGEIAALCWGGVFSDETALHLAEERGHIFARDARPGGSMLRVAMSAAESHLLATGAGVTIACLNGATDTVLAGTEPALDQIAAHLNEMGHPATRLKVSHAFHSADMEGAAPAFHDVLRGIECQPIVSAVVSTVTGGIIDHDTDVREMLVRQLTEPVRFDAAMQQAILRADVFVEVGPGNGLSRLVQERGIPCFHTDAFGASLEALLTMLAEIHVRGGTVNLAPLFNERAIRPFELSEASFLQSPCAPRGPGVGPALPPAPAQAEEEFTVAPLAPTDDALNTVLAILVAETGLPKSSFSADDRFLDKLHLNSLAVSRIVLAAARSLGCRPPSMPTEFANTTARILADSLSELRDFNDGGRKAFQRVGGVRRWVRTYAMGWTTSTPPRASTERISWMRAGDNDYASDFCSAIAERGVLIWLRGKFDVAQAELLLEHARGAARAGAGHLAICHDSAPISAFARSVALERHFRSVRVIDRVDAASTDPRIAHILGGVVDGYYETKLVADGRYEQPIFGLAEPQLSELESIGSGDVAVIVGGAKGITAECALRLGSRGAALVLVGRSPLEDEAVQATLARARIAGLRCRYVSANVLAQESLSSGLLPVLAEFGQATALVYAPAVNEPVSLPNLTNELLKRTLAPKTLGLENTLYSLGATLRHVVVFGSIIGRIGLEGEAHYALANAMQTKAIEAWAREKPKRSALAIEWSVWGAIGMGERLGTLDRLAAVGVDALPVDDALAVFDDLIGNSVKGVIAATGRFGPPRELALGGSDLPSLRFIDKVLVHFPRVELVVETTLSAGRDPYLYDHILGDHVVLPGVIALEAMAQAASILAPVKQPQSVTDVRFLRAVSFERGAEMRIRVAALATGRRAIEAVILAEDDAFREPFARAGFSPLSTLPEPISLSAGESGFDASPLYTNHLFQKGRFKRLHHVVRATSREVVATLNSAPEINWFGTFEPQRLVLWDPGVADATMHALQVAIPHRRVLPIGVQRIDFAGADTPTRVVAIERSAVDGTYIFDLTVYGVTGHPIQMWTGATFRAFERLNTANSFIKTPELIVPYIERIAREGLDDDTIKAGLIVDIDASRADRRTRVLDYLGVDDLTRRSDGRPIRTAEDTSVSITHCDGLTLALIGRPHIGCDLVKLPATGDIACSLELRQHVANECFRKIGRVSPRSLPSLNGQPITIEDARLIAIELSTSLGPHLIGLGGMPSQRVWATEGVTEGH